MMIPLMYEDPFYDVNYVYAGLLALVYYDLYEENPNDFAKAYSALMENGFDDKPDALLRRSLGIDLSDPAVLVARAVKVLRRKVDQYSAGASDASK